MLYHTEEHYISAERTAISGTGKHEKNRSSANTFAANPIWTDPTCTQAYVMELHHTRQEATSMVAGNLLQDAVEQRAIRKAPLCVCM
jgi:hypothetical protein